MEEEEKEVRKEEKREGVRWKETLEAPFKTGARENGAPAGGPLLPTANTGRSESM